MNRIAFQRVCVLVVVLIAAVYTSWACPVCERNQPKVLKGVVHGAGPESQWDYVIIWGFILITIASLYYSVKWLIKPGEKENDHIKYSILNDDQS